MIKNLDFNLEVKFILDILKKNLLSMPSIKRFDAKTGEVLESGDSYEDLADYLPFINYYNYDDLFNKELADTIDYLQNNSYIYVKPDRFPLGFFARSYAQSDLVFGLILASFENKKYIPLAEKTISQWYNKFFKNNAMFILRKNPLYSDYNLYDFLNFKLKIISSDDTGMFIEMFCLMYELTNKEDYLEKAKLIYLKMKNCENFKNLNYFFPFYFSENLSGKFILNSLNVFKKRDGEFELIKQNSNTLFGLIRLIKNSKGETLNFYRSEFKLFLDYFIKTFYDENSSIFYTNFNIKTKQKGSDLTVFHMIELFIEGFLIYDDKKYLDVANNIVSNIVEFQDKKTGLLSFLHPNSSQDLKRFNVTKNVSWLDAEIDFLVATLRLYELTKNNEYLIAMEKLLVGIVKYHKSNFGYSSIVDISSGKVTCFQYSTKMLALVLKAFIAFENIGKLNNKNDKIYYVLQDR